MRGTVSEDDIDGDPDDVSSRKTTINVEGKPDMGWVSLSQDDEEMIDYVFRGVDPIGETPKDDGTDGNGTPWKDTDAGTGVAYDTSKATTSTDSTGKQ